ncbi:CLEC4E [Branchiostoma lanceolatum]|uniref:CLEC4E protein n=1 Tax=Branchiostoma lanceolatum TaxID=7740 RepID=A0A8K0EPH3_BRALA|nr:CLEC4E [Branchiostoma lanceolatum]
MEGRPSGEEEPIVPRVGIASARYPTLGYIRQRDKACAGGSFNISDNGNVNISDHGDTNLATCAHLCTASGSCGAFVHVPGDSPTSCRLKRACPAPTNLTGADLYFKRLCNATAALVWGRTESVFTIVCPPGCASVAGPIYGDGMYSISSPVCKAAVHHGWLRDELGGAVTVRRHSPNLARTPLTSTRNGVTTLGYNGANETSFHFVHGCGSVISAASRTTEFYSNSPFDQDSECKLYIIGNPGGMIAPLYGYSLTGGDKLETHCGPNKMFFVEKFTNLTADDGQFAVPDVHEAYFTLTTGSQDAGQYLRVTGWGTWNLPLHCPYGWRALAGSCYYIGGTEVPYETAVSACHNMAAHVVEVNSEREEEILRAMTSSKAPGDYWVGLRFSQSKSWYNWWRQVPLAAQSSWWADGTDQTAAFGSDTCVIMDGTAGYRWTTQHCGLGARVICETEDA